MALPTKGTSIGTVSGLETYTMMAAIAAPLATDMSQSISRVHRITCTGKRRCKVNVDFTYTYM
jgi:hypothetical protein